MKVCVACKRELPVDSFARDAQKRDGRCSYCRDCHRERRRPYSDDDRERKREYDREYYRRNADVKKRRSTEWRRNNPGAHADVKAAYQRANPERYADYAQNRRARIRSQFVEHVDRAVVFERDGGKCHLCRCPVNLADAHIDHLVPVSSGGEHSYRNVALACAPCNLRRGAGRIPAQLRLTP